MTSPQKSPVNHPRRSSVAGGPAYERFLAALENAGQKVIRDDYQGTARAQCPSHYDNNPSLSVKAVEGMILVYCHAGCELSDVLEAMEMERRDLYDNPRGVTYRYRDGREVSRTPDKRFYQKCAHGVAPSKCDECRDKSPCLYRLDEVTRAVEASETVFLVEGEKDVESLRARECVAATTAPMGAKNFAKVDVSPLEGAHVVAIPDNDEAGGKWAAQVAEALQGVAARVRFMRVKEGKDVSDHLAAGYSLNDLVEIEPPQVTTPAEDEQQVSPEDFFGQGGLQALDLAHEVVKRAPCAITREGRVAVFVDGVYRIDEIAALGVVTGILGNRYRKSHAETAWEVVKGSILGPQRRFLPDRTDEPYLNCRNGLVDLRNGELVPHTPEYMSSYQIPIDYDPAATCPTYEAWLKDCAGDQMDDLEESVSPMLDPSRAPTKAVILFGKTRSGKGTFLRIARAIAGGCSSLSLHDLSEDRFAAANLYGQVLNIDGDGSAQAVRDISIFKKLTGEDEVYANPKYGKPFTFRNTALFLIGTNTLPTVNDGSRAYLARVRPFRFDNSFEGREDPSIESRIVRDELPGVLNRWIRANQRLRERGVFLPTAEDVADQFEAESNRIARFVIDHCEVGPEFFTTAEEIYSLYRGWVEIQGGKPEGLPKFRRELYAVSGVHSKQGGPNTARKRGANLRVVSITEQVSRDGEQSERQNPINSLQSPNTPSDPPQEGKNTRQIFNLDLPLTLLTSEESGEFSQVTAPKGGERQPTESPLTSRSLLLTSRSPEAVSDHSGAGKPPGERQESRGEQLVSSNSEAYCSPEEVDQWVREQLAGGPANKFWVIQRGRDAGINWLELPGGWSGVLERIGARETGEYRSDVSIPDPRDHREERK